MEGIVCSITLYGSDEVSTLFISVDTKLNMLLIEDIYHKYHQIHVDLLFLADRIIVEEARDIISIDINGLHGEITKEELQEHLDRLTGYQE